MEASPGFPLATRSATCAAVLNQQRIIGVIRGIFEHRSSRVIAVGRIVLALMFGLWVSLDPEQPVRGGPASYLLLVAYIACACALAPIAWRDWWLDYRLTVPSFVLDSAVFLAAVYCTDGEGTGFVSAYFAFFTFLTLSAALRWNWRVTLGSAVAISVLYFAMVLLLRGDGSWEVPAKALRRSSYLVLVSLIVTWFALQRSGPRVGKFTLPPAARVISPYEGALAYAMRATGASGAVLAWESSEEPGCTIQVAGSLKDATRRLPPGELNVLAESSPSLFDRGRRRMLELDEDRGLSVQRDGSGPALAEMLGLSQGLTFPVEGTTGFGQIVLVGIPGLCRDHLHLGQGLAREIAHGIDDEEISALAREAAAVRLRGNIARDLHDSVAQSLAGAGFLLSSLRQQIKAGKDVLPQIESISESLHDEQAHIREIIARLRSDEVNPGTRNLGTELDRLANALSRHWQVEVRFQDSTEPLVIPSWLVFEIQQLMREGIANAVRHGAAHGIRVHTERAPGGILLTIDDDGTGFGGEDAPMPQSLAERVEALGGKMAVTSRGDGSMIAITLPLGGRP